MKKHFIFLISLFLISGAIDAQTNISGTIVNNTTLTAANSPYIVTGNVNVNAGVTLTIETGVEVKFNSNFYIQVFGTMTANGATFTSNTTATAGAWDGIYVSYQYSADVGTVNLNNCLVEYAKAVYVRNGVLNLTNNTLIKDFSTFGLDIYTKGTANLSQTTIQNCSYPIYFRSDVGNGHFSIGEGVILTGNTNDYIFIDFRDVRDEFKLPDAGIPYYYNSELRVLEAGTLILDPGVKLLGNTGAYVTVYGKIKANGTDAQPVLFSTDPSSSYWAGINFYDAAVDSACYFNYTEFSGANYTYSNYRPYEIDYCAMQVISSSPVFNNCLFSNNRYNLVISGQSRPSFSNCNFLASNLVDKQTLNINQDLNAEPQFINCAINFNNSEARAIGIIGSTIIHDSHLRHQSFTGIDSISYTLIGQVTVHDTASLVIDPGVVIKCTGIDDYIYANGELRGIGTGSQPIVFTHVNDDDFGNPADTYNDGTTSIASSSGGRIILNGLVTSTVKNWKIHYAGRSSSNYAVVVYNGSILENCEIMNSHRAVIFNGDAQIINNKLENIATYPLSRRMNPGSPTLLGNSVINSGHMGIYVYDFMDGAYSIGGMDIGGNTNVAYIIDTDTPIPVGADVTILPGTVFKMTYYYGKISVRGGLKAMGKKNNKIIFTSLYDNSASGNTNFNTGADPTGYKWSGIEFFDTSLDNNQMKNSEVRYVYNGLKMTNCKVVVDSTLLNFSDSHALEIYGSANPEIRNSSFINLNASPIQMDMFSNPSFSGNSIANVARIGINIKGGTISGTVPIRSFAGYDTITYLIAENIRVDNQLIIPAGLTFKGSGSAYFDIYGTLNIEGTADRPVVFTSLQDDAYGSPRDTEQNGQASVSKTGNRLVYRDISNDNSMINHAVFRYSYDYAVYNESVSPVIKNSSFYNTNRCGIYLVGSSAPAVDSCIFKDLQYPIITSLMTFPRSNQGNVITGTTARGIYIIDNETLTQNYTLTKRSFAGIANIPSRFERYNVGTSAVLTIEPGVVCKFIQNGYMIIRNGLIANGGSTPDSAIIFTADRDDFYGGDTYADGDASPANDRWWRGLYFPGESIDGSCLLDNCIFKNATYLYSNSANVNNRAAVTLDNSSPGIQNCLFENNYWGIIVRNTSLPGISNCDFVETNPTYGYGLWNETGSVTVLAENCWWNDASGPYNATLNPAGLGERVSNNVDFTPWITQTAKPIMGDVSLNGEVMPYDASLVLQHTVGNITLDAKQIAVADVSGNQSVSSYDASLILQFSIGLITNFEQSGKKATSLWTDPMLSAPAVINASLGSSFEIPVSFTTPETVKSIDMQFVSDPRHLKFTGLNTKALPPDIMVAYGYKEESGILKISVTSAFDLDLNNDELGLVFELTSAGINESMIELVQLAANEISLDESLIGVEIRSGNDATAFEEFPGLSFINVSSNNGLVIAEIQLSSNQSRLEIAVYDLAGKMTNFLNIENPEAGVHKFHFEAEPNSGDWSPKLYMVSISGDDFTVTRKLVLR